MLGLTQQKSSALLSPRLKTSGLAIVLRVDDESRVESDVRYRPWRQANLRRDPASTLLRFTLL